MNIFDERWKIRREGVSPARKQEKLKQAKKSWRRMRRKGGA